MKARERIRGRLLLEGPATAAQLMGRCGTCRRAAGAAAVRVLAWVRVALAAVWRESRAALVQFFEDQANPGSKKMGDAIREAERTTHPRVYRRRSIR